MHRTSAMGVTPVLDSRLASASAGCVGLGASLQGGSSKVASKKLLLAGVLLAIVSSPGCWEQVSPEWWPQMKWQIAVQSYELNPYQDRVSLFAPPEGTVPVNWGTSRFRRSSRSTSRKRS